MIKFLLLASLVNYNFPGQQQQSDQKIDQKFAQYLFGNVAKTEAKILKLKLKVQHPTAFKVKRSTTNLF
jgi:hypothetical protein